MLVAEMDDTTLKANVSAMADADKAQLSLQDSDAAQGDPGVSFVVDSNVDKILNLNDVDDKGIY